MHPSATAPLVRKGDRLPDPEVRVALVWSLILALEGVGFTIMFVVARRPRARPVAVLRRWGVDPHLWGFHLVAMGAVSFLLVGVLDSEPKSASGIPALVAVGLGILWLAVAGVLLLAPFFSGGVGGWKRHLSRGNLIPGPRVPVAAWSWPYRVFLLTGTLVLVVLAGFRL